MSQVRAAEAAAFLPRELTYAADALLGTALGHGLFDVPKALRRAERDGASPR